MSQRLKLRSFLRRTMNKVSSKEKSSKERLNEEKASRERLTALDSGDVAEGEGNTGAEAASLPVVTSGGEQPDRGTLERTISELVHNVEGKKQEIAALRQEIRRLKEPGGTGTGGGEELEQLRSENQTLRARLEQLGRDRAAPISDTEKQALMLRRCSCSAPASILGGSAEALPPQHDWDKQSSSSVSEMSVADLQDRIVQMEETHHSTNEELQATLQELTDLQAQLAAVRQENKQLLEQKDVLLESLCAQTERLEDAKQQLQHSRQLLVREEADRPRAQEREHMLRDLLKGAQDERDSLQARLEELQERLEQAGRQEAQRQQQQEQLVERLRQLEESVGASAAERKQVELQLQEARQQAAELQIETERLSQLLDNANGKIDELQQVQAANNRSELEALLDQLRQEKGRVDQRAADLQEALSRSQCELSKLQEQLTALQQETVTVKNNANRELSEAQARHEQLVQEKSAAVAASEELQEHLQELELTCQRHLEDKRDLKAGLSEQQKRVTSLQDQLTEIGAELSEAREKHRLDTEEWKQFQDDLLMSVRVANDFRTEAQEHMEKMAMENHRLREKVNSLAAEVEKARAAAAAAAAAAPVSRPPPAPAGSPASERRPLRTVQAAGELGRARRTSLKPDSKLCVKTLIETIESANKQAKAGSRSSSTSSLNSEPQHARLTASASSPLYLGPEPAPSPTPAPPPPGQRPFVRSYTDNLFSKASVSDSVKATALKSGEDGKPLASILANKLDTGLRRTSYSDQPDKKDPLAPLVKNGGSRRNALLKWCQNKTIGYTDVDITNFSSSWNDGMALCALLHSYMPDKVPYETLRPNDKRRNFNTAFQAAESVGIPTTLNTNDMVSEDRPDWQQVLAYVTSIYKHFET